MSAAFAPAIVQKVATAEEVDIETSPSPDKRSKPVTIWIVVADGQVYVRSVRGPAGKWWRNLTARPTGTLHVEGQALPVRAIPVADLAEIQRVSDAFATKYAKSPYMPPMLAAETLPTTLRLEPA